MRSWVVVAALLTSACGGSAGLVNTGAVGVVDAAALPPPTRADVSSGRQVSALGPFDKIAINVLGVPDLSQQEVQIDSNGQFAMPVAGVIDANGKTPREAAMLAETALRAGGVRNPQVTINLREAISQTMTVDGAVKMPGVYPVAGQSTLMRAVARAQGATDNADTSRVVIFRTVDGKRMAALYDLRAIRSGAYEDPTIYASDLVVVGDSAISRLLPILVQGASALVTPVIYLLQR